MSSSSQFLAIESADRASGSSHDFRYTLPYSIRNVHRITLLNAEIPNTCYNVRSPYNTFTFAKGATPGTRVWRTVSVAEGVYTVTSLLTALAAAMAAADTASTYSFTTSTTTLKITLTSSTYTHEIGDTYLSRSLGFVSGQGASTTITANNTYVIGDMFLFLQIRNLPTNVISTASAQFRIPLTADTGYIQFLTSAPSNEQFIDMDGSSSLGHLDICIVDQYGNAVSLNGGEFSLFLRVDTQ